MNNYHVKTSEEFFNRYRTMMFAVQNLAGMFQNEGAVISEGEKQEWSQMADQVKADLDRLLSDSLTRITEVNS